MPFTVNENFRLKRMAAFAASCDTILDVGCAQYPNTYLLNKEVIGLDISSATMPKNYTEFIQGNLTACIKNKRQFCGVLAGEIIEHLEQPIQFLKECQQVLKPGGVLILSTPNPHSPIEQLLTLTLNKKYFYTKDHIMLFPQRWLIRMLEISGFKEISLHSGGFPMPFVGLIPFPRFLCHQTIAVAVKA